VHPVKLGARLMLVKTGRCPYGRRGHGGMFDHVWTAGSRQAPGKHRKHRRLGSRLILENSFHALITLGYSCAARRRSVIPLSDEALISCHSWGYLQNICKNICKIFAKWGFVASALGLLFNICLFDNIPQLAQHSLLFERRNKFFVFECSCFDNNANFQEML